MQFDWVSIDSNRLAAFQSASLPPQRRFVLVQFRLADEERVPLQSVGHELVTVHSPGVAAAFWIEKGGKVKWIVPGLSRPGTTISHYCDCLGDRFRAPEWPWPEEISEVAS